VARVFSRDFRIVPGSFHVVFYAVVLARGRLLTPSKSRYTHQNGSQQKCRKLNFCSHRNEDYPFDRQFGYHKNSRPFCKIDPQAAGDSTAAPHSQFAIFILTASQFARKPVAPGPGPPRTGFGPWGGDLAFETWETTDIKGAQKTPKSAHKCFVLLWHFNF
jgi:hypothetical protein